jgi:hypothetical protein
LVEGELPARFKLEIGGRLVVALEQPLVDADDHLLDLDAGLEERRLVPF